MKKRKEDLVGKTFKCVDIKEHKEWKGSVLKVLSLWDTVNGKTIAGVRELITGNEYNISKDAMESDVFYEVEQDKRTLKDLEFFARKKAMLVEEVELLKKAQDALSKITPIFGQRDFDANLASIIERASAEIKSMEKSWKLRLNMSYRKIG